MPDENKLSPDKGAISRYLQFLFGDMRDYSDGKIEVAFADAEGRPNQSRYFELDGIDDAIAFSHDKNSENSNIYIGAALRSPDVAPFGRSNLSDFYVTGAVWVDLDDESAVDQAKARYRDMPPSMVVVTGRHPHRRAQLWWKLIEPCDDPGDVRAALAGLAHALDGDKMVVDPIRIMRCGGTVAWPVKQGRVTELTSVLIFEDRKPVSIDYIRSAFPAPVNEVTARLDDGMARKAISGKLDIYETLERTRHAGHWHNNMRAAIACMVGQGWTDEQILLACGSYCHGGVHDPDLAPLVIGARKKWNIPNPAPEDDLRRLPETLPFIMASDIEASTDTNDFVEDLLGDNQLSVVYGDANSGKTFFMADLALHVALGVVWRDRIIEQGPVVYAALEGGWGIKNRIAAFKKHYRLGKDHIPLAVLPSSLDLHAKDGDIRTFISGIKELEASMGPPRLIVIDTLARAMASGDENSASDMGQLIHHVDQIREATKAHVTLIHHSGKDTSKGARGHSSLRGAIDTEIELSRDHDLNMTTVKVRKQREMEIGKEFHFSLETVTLGTNRHGKAITSCVVLPCEKSEIVPRSSARKLGDAHRSILDGVHDALIVSGKMLSPEVGMSPQNCVTRDHLREALSRKGFYEGITPQRAAQKLYDGLNALKSKGFICFNKAFIWSLGK